MLPMWMMSEEIHTGTCHEQPVNLATLVSCTIVLKDMSKELQGRKSFKITKTKDAYSNSAIRKD